MTNVDGVRRVYSRGAADYDVRWARYLDLTIERTLLHVPSSARDGPLLDVGCGTGLLLDRLADRLTRKPVGVDLSPEMLEVARSRLVSRASLVLADVAALPFGSASLGLVTCSSSFHHWPDRRGGLREIARVLRPGGTLVLTDWRADHPPTLLRDLWLRVKDPSHHRAATLGGARADLREVGFRVTGIDRYSLGWSWGFMTITAVRPSG